MIRTMIRTMTRPMSRLAKLAILIAGAALTASGQFGITTKGPLPTAIVGQTYTPFILQTTGDNGPVVWSIPVGQPTPTGFTVGNAQPPDTTGVFCYGSPCTAVGVQAAPNVYTFTITATSLSSGQVANKVFSMAVVTSSLQITTTSLPNAVANQGYTAQLQAIGGSGNYTWSLVESTLPQGILLDPATGSLSGVAPNTNATFTFTVQVTDQAAQLTATQTLSINVIQNSTPTISITTTSLPNATLNVPYFFQLQGTGPATVVWSLQQTAQTPPGFLISPSGVLSGFPAALGKFSITAQLTDGSVAGAPSSVTRTFPLNITLGPLSIQEVSLPGATQSTPYSTTLTPVGGLPPYTWSVDPANPASLTIDPNGTLSGTPPNAGLFDVPVTLTDATGAFFSRIYSLSVTRAVTITTASPLPNGQPGAPYRVTLAAAGGSIPFTWTVTGSLPPGLGLDAVSGAISGTPTTQGAFQFTIKVTDFSKGTATKAFTIIIGVVQPLTITTTSLPDSALTQSYSQTVAATGGVAPYTWRVSSGALPAGLQLSATTGVISGTPTRVGNFVFEILATDSAQTTARQALSINVADPANPVVISSGNFTGLVLTSFSQTLAATGGTAPYTWAITFGTLPTGLQLNGAAISGSPGAAGTSIVTFVATDANGQRSAPKPITFTISLPQTPPITITLGSTTQPALSLTIGTPYPSEISGLLTLDFASSVGGTDKMVTFSNGGTTLDYIVRANQTTAIFPTATNPAILTGTVAGTITLTASLSASGLDITPSPAPTKTIVIAKAVPVISSVALQQVTGGLNVVVKGYSNTREVSSGSFTFAVSSGNTLSQSQVTVPLSPAFTTWFNNTASNATGGLFQLIVPFSVTGNATAITKVGVTLTNSVGTSAAVSSP